MDGYVLVLCCSLCHSEDYQEYFLQGKLKIKILDFHLVYPKSYITCTYQELSIIKEEICISKRNSRFNYKISSYFKIPQVFVTADNTISGRTEIVAATRFVGGLFLLLMLLLRFRFVERASHLPTFQHCRNTVVINPHQNETK